MEQEKPKAPGEGGLRGKRRGERLFRLQEVRGYRAALTVSSRQLLMWSSECALLLDVPPWEWPNGGVTEIPIQKCPRCGEVLPNIKGARISVCRRCGYKDDCC